jgi:hypothetical protein
MDISQISKQIVADSSNKDIWLTARMNGVTASDVANFEEGAKLHSLVYKKLNNTFKGNKWTDWGLDREPIILNQVGFPQNTNLFKSADNERFMATPDGFRVIDGEFWLCQVKTTSKGWEEPPANYVRQCQWEMFVMGADKNLLAWEQHADFVPVELEPKSLVIDRDDAEIERLKEMAYEFLTELEKQKEGI